MRALVVYGSKRGGTAGLAEMVGQAFRDVGHEVDVREGSERFEDLSAYDVVVIGGGLYANRWQKDARRFARRHQDLLRTRPVWLFSSGPLDDSAEKSDIGPTAQVAKAMVSLGARGHETFGGSLAPDVHGFPASSLAKTHAGDFRDRDHVRRWVQGICEELETGPTTGD
jgi:menaquinone-dependent protoporphyrinogen oxidase